MNEIKPQRKPLMYYTLIVLVVILLLNGLVMPYLRRAAVKEVDYNTFMTMTESSQVKEVEIRADEILFIGTDDQIYATGPVNDPELVSRLHEKNIQFGTDIRYNLGIIFFVSHGDQFQDVIMLLRKSVHLIHQILQVLGGLYLFIGPVGIIPEPGGLHFHI